MRRHPVLRAILIGIVILGIPSSAVGETTNLSPLTVSVNVHPVKNPKAGALTRYLEDQLEKLPHTHVVDSGGSYRVDVFVMEVKMGSGRIVGTVAHTSVFEPLVPPDARSRFVCGYVMEDLDWQNRKDKSREAFERTYSDYHRKLQSFMNLWNGNTEGLAKKIVGTVDSGLLSHRRQSRREIEQSFEEIPYPDEEPR